MPLLSTEERTQLIKETREAAAAFIEDMPHLREVLNRVDPDRGELRRSSSVLRRLLIDKGGDLRDIAAPRIGRFTILSPDIGPIHKSARKSPLEFFQSAGVKAFGVQFATGILEKASKPRDLPGYSPDATVALPMDNFLSQQVLCLKGEWVTRRDTIKYMANIGSGVHSGQPKEAVHRLLNRIRHAAIYKTIVLGPDSMAPGEKAAGLAINMDALSNSELPFSYDPQKIDPVLIELLAAAHHLAISPDIMKLEGAVREELGM
jgi:hypothetical protein